jgi:hypothetical protein
VSSAGAGAGAPDAPAAPSTIVSSRRPSARRVGPGEGPGACERGRRGSSTGFGVAAGCLEAQRAGGEEGVLVERARLSQEVRPRPPSSRAPNRARRPWRVPSETRSACSWSASGGRRAGARGPDAPRGGRVGKRRRRQGRAAPLLVTLLLPQKTGLVLREGARNRRARGVERGEVERVGPGATLLVCEEMDVRESGPRLPKG